jgi:hypothetical protein
MSLCQRLRLRLRQLGCASLELEHIRARDVTCRRQLRRRAYSMSVAVCTKLSTAGQRDDIEFDCPLSYLLGFQPRDLRQAQPQLRIEHPRWSHEHTPAPADNLFTAFQAARRPAAEVGILR